jgi:sigma-B regulation protein RsbU (phosphoserine phosphatase)
MSEREIIASLETDWQQRLAAIVEMMRDMSRHTDPQEMVRAYGERIRPFIPEGHRLSLSRRGLKHPQYRITRSTTWTEEIDPWKEPHRLPLHTGGLLSELIYGEEPVVIDDLEFLVDDPAAEYFAGHRSLVAIPMYDQGESLNMVILLQRDPHAFPREDLADYVWRTNLFGRATSTLVLKEELRKAYQTLDRELKIVGEIQRSLLPAKLPKISTLDLAAHYQPAHRAGGDYYDFFPLPEGKWGVFIGDVSGHGTPAAVLMAVTHCIAHTHPGPPMPPGTVLEYINQHLAERYTHHTDTFVTAFFGVYDPAAHTLTYASAGHNPPRLKCCRDGDVHSLEGPGGLPLGIIQHARYEESVQTLHPGDQLIFYTDGITEAHNPQGELFSVERLDAELQACQLHAGALMDSVLSAVETFADGRPADDDRTLIVARVIE